jgi:hypothetical protein
MEGSTMNIAVKIGRKIIAAIISSIILSLFLTMTGYSTFDLSNFIVIFMVSTFFALLIGLPCSLVIDLIGFRIKKKSLNSIFGFVMHLCCAGVVAYLFIRNDSTFNDDGFIFAVVASAAGIWLIDALLRNRMKA